MIAIPNMEKPKHCTECYFVCRDQCELQDNSYDYDTFKEQKKHCPLQKIDLVRCGECRWCDDKGKGRALICTNPYIDMDIHPSYFCPYGERRADESTIKANIRSDNISGQYYTIIP